MSMLFTAGEQEQDCRQLEKLHELYAAVTASLGTSSVQIYVQKPRGML